MRPGRLARRLHRRRRPRALYTARTYPKEYWNRTAFVCRADRPPGRPRSCSARAAADFRSRNAWNLLASDDEWTAPIMAEVGPDGNVWVIDWYNFIVQHNPTPAGFKTGKGNAYETDLRDKKHGRIYRVVYDGAKPQAAFTLKDATPEKLVETLKHDNLFWRRHAQRLLVERGKTDVVPALSSWPATRVDEIGLNVGVIHALWTLHGLWGWTAQSRGDGRPRSRWPRSTRRAGSAATPCRCCRAPRATSPRSSTRL